MAHPLRLRMLSLLTAAPMSATELARELDIAHAAASYHVHQLADAGLVHVVEEERPAGAGRPPVRYRHDPAVGTRLDRSEGRELAFAALVEDLGRRVAGPHTRRQFADAEVWLDPADWETVCALADRIVDIVHQRARPPRAPGSVHGSATLAVFELDQPDQEPEP
jgi:predicted ArsR family transcriptional regulator